MRVLTFAAGIVCLFAVLLDAFQTIILPRRATGRFRLTRIFYAVTWKPWVFFARRLRSPRKREAAFSYYGPLSLIFLLVVWAGAMVVGFALIFYALGSPFNDGVQTAGLRTDLYVSGTTIFTLGLGDVTPHSLWAREIIIFEAGTGFGFLAVVMGYIPVLYSAFSRRESVSPCSMRGLDLHQPPRSSCAAMLMKAPRTLFQFSCWSGNAGRQSCSKVISPTRFCATSARNTTTRAGLLP